MAKSLNTLAEKADALYEMREARLAAQREVDAMKAEETKLTNELISAISKSDATGVAGKLVRVSVVTKPVPSVKDWDALWTYIVRRKAYDLVQRRLSDTAVKSRWEDGVDIPGVESFTTTALSINKV